MRFRLRTLLILLAILPPFIAWWGWPTMQRILWPPKPATQFDVLGIDFSIPVQQPAMDVPEQVEQWIDPDALVLYPKRSSPPTPPRESFAPPDRRP